MGQRLSVDKESGHVILTASPTCMRAIGETECGHCVRVVSGEKFFIGEGKDYWYNGKPWSKLRDESVLLPAEESYAPLASYVIDSCKKLNCSSEVQAFRVKLDSLNGLKNALKFP